MTAAAQSTTFGNYLRFVQNAAPVPHDFLIGLQPRIELAYDMGGGGSDPGHRRGSTSRRRPVPVPRYG